MVKIVALEEFLSDVSKNVERHLVEAKKFIGKEVIDSEALKKGVIMDYLKDYNGLKVSLMGYKYRKDEIKRIKDVKDDFLVCVTSGKKAFIPISLVKAVGSIVLLSKKLSLPEMKERDLIRKKSEILERYNSVRQRLKKFLPDMLRAQQLERKSWLDRIMGEGEEV